jgi:putative transposase
MHGGKRAGSGRKRSPARKGFIPHRVRPVHDWRHPVHVSFKAVPGAPGLRTQRVLKLVHGLIERVVRRYEGRFRVNHFSVQSNHLHLIVEADDRVRIWRGVQWLSSRLARSLNALVDRRGTVWRDRYHRRDLATPREVRNALVYVLMNIRKHAAAWARPLPSGSPPLDPCSSAAWFDAWDSRAAPLVSDVRGALAEWGMTKIPTTAPETWLGRSGWKQHGLVRPTELPREAIG